MDNMKNVKKKVLIICAYFYPGFRSGGPQQSVINMVDAFGDKSDIYILTQNHDAGISEPYEGLSTNVWLPFGKAKVKYLPAKDFRYKGIRREYKKFDTVFSCGMFEPNTIALLLIHRFAKKKKNVYVAPMGVFSEKAINSKKLKKSLFLHVCKLFGVFGRITWSFTSEMELKEAKKILGERDTCKYIVAEDIPRKVSFGMNRQWSCSRHKELDKLRIVFISRICIKKNLDFCFDVLSGNFKGDIVFDVYGIIEDKKYWDFCKQKSKRLKQQVYMNYCGSIKPEQVIPTLLKYDVFFFPTKGENYGHVIYEALCAGCVPIITDTTPWKDLDIMGAGNVIPYGDRQSFYDKICEYLRMGDCEFRVYKENAISYAESKFKSAIKNSGYKKVFYE